MQIKHTPALVLISALFLRLSLFAANPIETIDNVMWEYSVRNGAATITAVQAAGDITTITVPDTLGGYPVSTLGGRFNSYTNLVSVVIPSSVHTISANTFYSCKSLKSVTLNEGLTDINQSAFKSCTSLEAINFPSTLKNIYSDAFYGCQSLTSLEFNEGLEFIDRETFVNCISLKAITLPSTLTEIGQSGFASTAIEKVEIPGSVKTLSSNVFYNCIKLESVTLNEGLRELGLNAFSGCSSLKYITLPSTLVSIGSNGFLASGLEKIEIPDSVTSIGSYCFNNCASLRGIVLGKGITSVPLYFCYNCPALHYIEFRGNYPSLSSYWYDNARDPAVMIFVPDGNETWRPALNASNVYLKSQMSETPDAPWDLAFYKYKEYPEKMFLTAETNSVAATTTFLAGDPIYFRCAMYDRWNDMDITTPITNTIQVVGRDIIDYPHTDNGHKKGTCTVADYLAPCLQGLEPGKYTVVSTINYLHFIPETTYENNTLSLDFEVLPSTTITFISEGIELFKKRYLKSSEVSFSIADIPIRYGYDFDGWYTEEVGGELIDKEKFIAPEEDRSFYAHWVPHVPETINVKGTLNNGENVWLSGNVYVVDGSVVVPRYATLIIQPGAIIKLKNVGVLKVESGAKLIAKGMRTLPIVFTSINDDSNGGKTVGSNSFPMGGDWGSINIYGEAEVAYCTIMYGAPNNETGLVQVASGGSMTMNACTLAHAKYDGIWNWGGSIKVTNTIIFDVGNAIAPYRRGDVNEYNNCVFYGCNDLSMYWSHWTGKPVFNNCIFMNMVKGWVDTNGNGDFHDDMSFNNCCFWNEPGIGKQSCEKETCFYADPLLRDPEHGDFQLMPGSPCIDAANATAAPATDYYGHERLNEPDIGICEYLPNSLISDFDLVPISVGTDSQTVLAGQSISVSWSIRNAGSAVISGNWRDTISLISNTGKEVSLGEKTTIGTISLGETISCSEVFTVPAIDEGTWYLKVNVNSYHDIFEGSLSQNNVLLGKSGIEVGIETISDIGCNGNIDALSPKVLKLELDDNDDKRMVHIDVIPGVTVLYGFGFIPTVDNNSGSITSGNSGAYLHIPPGKSETYIVIISDTTTPYKIERSEDALKLAHVSVSELPSAGSVSIIAEGAGFVGIDAVELVGTVEVVPLDYTVIDDNRISIQLECDELKEKVYALRIRKGDASAILAQAFQVVSSNTEGGFWIEITAPDSVREKRVFTVRIRYGNSSKANVDAELIRLSTSGGTTARLPGDTEFATDVFIMAKGDVYHQESLAPGEIHSVIIECMAGPEAHLEAFTTAANDNFEVSPWPSIETFKRDYLAALKMFSRMGIDVATHEEALTVAQGLFNGDKGVVGGKIVNENNESVKGAVVTLKNLTDEENLIATTSNERGLFAFFNLKEGDYSIDVDYGVDTILEHSEVLVDNRISLASSQVKDDLSVVVNTTVNLEISVDGIDSDMAMVSVTPISDKDKGSLPVRYDSERKLYCVTGVRESGVYIVNVKLGDCESEKTVFLSSDYTDSLTITPHPKVDVFGNLTSVESFVLPDEQPFVIAESSTMTRYTCDIDAEGKFSFEQLPAGKYSLHVCGVFRSYSFEPTYDFSIGGRFDISVNPVDEVNVLEVTYPASWAEKYVIVITDNYGVINCDEATISGRSVFTGVGTGVWSCYALDLTGGHIIDEKFCDTKTSRSVDLGDNGTTRYLSMSRIKRAFGATDATNKMYAIWTEIRDFSAEKLTGFDWANDIVGWFQSDKYTASRNILWEAIELLGREVYPPCNCYCGYNLRKYQSDLRSKQSFAKQAESFATYLRRLDNMKGVASTFKLVGDSAEEYMKYRLKFRGEEVFGEFPKIVNAFNNFFNAYPKIKSALDHAFAVYQTRKDIIAVKESFESLTSGELSGFQTLITTIENSTAFVASFGDLFDMVNRLRPLMKINNPEILEALNLLPEQIEAAGDVCDALEIFTEALTIIDDVKVTIEEFSKYKDAVDEFNIRFTNFKAHCERYRRISDNFNKYHKNECYMQCPIIEKPKIWDKTPKDPKSEDPNEMVGPMGFGDSETQRFVKPGEWMTYTVYFENKAQAAAAAQEVFVTNPLSEYLDWSTFEMGEVAYNNHIDLGLVGKQNGESEIALENTNYRTRTSVKIDKTTGQIDWYLRVVDPTTPTKWPDDPYAGFLPPNDETHRGEGHLTYRIKVREDAPGLAKIDNAATIVFDYNDPIPTDPAWWNTVAPETYEPQLVDSALSVYEGETAEITVFGGSTSEEMSVKLNLTHNTTTAADIQKGLKFPMTLTWAKGEVGNKTVNIAALVDKSIEADEFFTCQVGESLLTVTIKDSGYEALKERVENKTASAADLKTWASLEKAKKVYGRAIPLPYEGGKVSGSKAVAAGAKMSFKATANKGYVPIGWYDGETLVTKEAAYSFVMPETNVTYFAKFMKAEDDANEITIDVGGTTGDVGNLMLAATNLYVGVKVDMPIESAAVSKTTVKVAKLPTGLKYDAKLAKITGVPTKAGVFNTTFTVTTAGKVSKVFTMPITTIALPSWAVGTFNGGYIGTNELPNGLTTLTITAAGKISGKIIVGENTWTVSAANFTSFEDEDDTYYATYRATLKAKCGKSIDYIDILVDCVRVYGSGIDAYQNLWKTRWKDRGAKIAANSDIKKNGLPLPSDFTLPWAGAGMTSLQLKFAASGKVSATANFELKDSKGKPITYKSTCSTVLIPIELDSGEIVYALYLHFTPNWKKGFYGSSLRFIYRSLENQ